MSDQILNLLMGSATLAAPLILAAIGGLFSERAGVMNIALEGKMLMAACLGALVGLLSGSAWLGVLAAVAGGVILSLLHVWLTEAFRVDQIVSGMGINALALGATTFLAQSLPIFQSSQRVPAPANEVFWLLSVGAVVACWFVLGRTRPGLRLLAVGNDPEKSRSAGLKPFKVRVQALIATGVLCGLAGALLVGNAGSFVNHMTSGRGYIALSALILGGWRPIPVFVAALLFGLVQSVQLNFQGSPILGVSIPSEFWQMLPYLATLLALVLVLGNNKAPAGLGKP